MDSVDFLTEERRDELWKNDPQPSRISGLEAAIAEITRLRAALEFFAQDNNWQRNGQLDSSSPEFNGCKIARAALENS